MRQRQTVSIIIVTAMRGACNPIRRLSVKSYIYWDLYIIYMCIPSQPLRLVNILNYLGALFAVGRRICTFCVYIVGFQPRNAVENGSITLMYMCWRVPHI